jgi:MFS family permease
MRGLALSITSSGASFGMFLFPPIVTMLIASYGWRGTYALLGVLAIVVFGAGASFIVRDPEEIGLHPDGLTPEEVSIADATLEIVVTDNWTLAEARETKAFWTMNAIFTLTWLVVFMPMVHIVPFAVDIGLTPFLAAMTISVIGVGGFAGRLVMGPISDRLGRLSTLGVCLLLQAMSFLVFGFSYGGVTSLFPALVGDFFGRIAIGAIVGFIFAIAGSAAAFGPLIAGYLYDATRSYNLAFLLSATLNLAALLLLFVLKKPERATYRRDVRA